MHAIAHWEIRNGRLIGLQNIINNIMMHYVNTIEYRTAEDGKEYTFEEFKEYWKIQSNDWKGLKNKGFGFSLKVLISCLISIKGFLVDNKYVNGVCNVWPSVLGS